MDIKFEEQIASEQMRAVRGYAIISKGDTPKELDKNMYSIPSQHDTNINYTVRKILDKWTCDCPDFSNRQTDCKHIHAVKFYKQFQQKVEESKLPFLQAEKPACPYCNSHDTIKMGKRKCKTVIKQRYGCDSCRRRFIPEKDFQRLKGDAKTTTAILDMYFKGMSLRAIQDHLKQIYNLNIHHSNILRRIYKYSRIINDYVQTLQPELKDVWHTDEMKIQAGGKWVWLWNVMDAETRFLITRMVSDQRRMLDSAKVLKDARSYAHKQPKFIITDGCVSYARSIAKALPNTQHVRLRSIRDKRNNNNNIERLNGTIRDRIKTMRGLHSANTADTMTTAICNYYNFVKQHSTIGCTPAEAANYCQINGNKWLRLINKTD